MHCTKHDLKMKWTGVTPYGETYRCPYPGCLQNGVTHRPPKIASRKTSVTCRRCSNCGADISHKRLGAKTCSSKCRKAKQRKG